MQGIEPTHKAAGRALRQAVIHRTLSWDPSTKWDLCRSRLLTNVTSLRQQGNDINSFQERSGQNAVARWLYL
jgi:hypothetical protein